MHNTYDPTWSRFIFTRTWDNSLNIDRHCLALARELFSRTKMIRQDVSTLSVSGWSLLLLPPPPPLSLSFKLRRESLFSLTVSILVFEKELEIQRSAAIVTLLQFNFPRLLLIVCFCKNRNPSTFSSLSRNFNEGDRLFLSKDVANRLSFHYRCTQFHERFHDRVQSQLIFLPFPLILPEIPVTVTILACTILDELVPPRK